MANAAALFYFGECDGLLYLIFVSIHRKTANGTLPFSEEGWNEVKSARRNILFAVLGLVFGCIVAGVLLPSAGDMGLVLMIAVLIGGTAGIGLTSKQIKKVYPFATLCGRRGRDADAALTRGGAAL